MQVESSDASKGSTQTQAGFEVATSMALLASVGTISCGPLRACNEM